GRWASLDPAGTIDGLNLYRYASNNPVRLADATGLQGHEPSEAEAKSQTCDPTLRPEVVVNPGCDPTQQSCVEVQLDECVQEYKPPPPKPKPAPKPTPKPAPVPNILDDPNTEFWGYEPEVGFFAG